MKEENPHQIKGARGKAVPKCMSKANNPEEAIKIAAKIIVEDKTVNHKHDDIEKKTIRRCHIDRTH